jgi:propanediol dehydratase large subunit
MSEIKMLESQLRICSECARSSPDEFTYLNTAAREALRRAAAALAALRSLPEREEIARVLTRALFNAILYLTNLPPRGIG